MTLRSGRSGATFRRLTLLALIWGSAGCTATINPQRVEDAGGAPSDADLPGKLDAGADAGTPSPDASTNAGHDAGSLPDASSPSPDAGADAGSAPPDARTPVVCPPTLQGAVDATPSGGTLDLTGCTYSAGAVVARPLTLLGATIQPPAGTRGLLVTANDVTLDGLHILGPQAVTYQSDEVGIEASGTVAAPVQRLIVRNCEVGNFGYGGMYLQQLVDLRVEQNDVHDGVYAGIMVLSGDSGLVDHNTVRRIGVVGAQANGNNAYGIALSQANPAVDLPTADFTVSNNTVEDVPTWHAFDTHSGQRIVWTGNVSRRSRTGIFITGYTDLRALDNDINGNRFEAPTGADHYAIVSVYSTGGYVRNNVTVGWPAGHELLTTSAGDPDATAQGLVVEPNNTWLP